MTRVVRLLLGVDTAVWGGAETYVAHLLRELPDRFACTVLATEPVPPRLAAAAAGRADLVVVPAVRSKRDVRALVALARAVRAARPDLVHVNCATPTNNRHLLLVAVALRVPVVPVLHLWTPLGHGLQRRLLRAAWARVPVAVAVSADLAARAVDELGARPEAVTVVRNGVPATRPARGSGGGRLRVGAVGRLVTHKGFDVLLEALALLGPLQDDLEVHVAGDGPERAALEAAARGLPVRLLGELADVAPFLDGLDAFVLPSRDEGLPMALLEAMTAALPCVVTAVGDVPEAVGDTAVVVPPGDAPALAAALRSLLEDAAARRRLGTRARERVLATGSVAAMVAATADAYDAAVARRSAA